MTYARKFNLWKYGSLAAYAGYEGYRAHGKSHRVHHTSPPVHSHGTWPGPMPRPEKPYKKDETGKVMASTAYIKGSHLTPAEKLRFHDAPSLEYQYANSFSVTSGAGVGINPSIYTITDIQSIYGASAFSSQLVAGAFGSSTTQAGLAPVTSVNADVDVLTKSAEWTFEIVNMGPNIAFGTLYICKARDDTTSITVPSSAWEQGVDDEAGVTATYGTAAVVKSTWPFGRPKPAKGFRATWTIVGAYDMDFDPGETKRHTVVIGINKIRSYNDIIQCTNGCLKGVTHYAFMVARGGPGDTSNTTAAGTIEFTPIKLIAIHGIKMRIAVAEKPSKVLNQYSGLPTSGSTNLYTMNDDTGANVNVNTVNYG